jgi:hypothetical protein
VESQPLNYATPAAQDAARLRHPAVVTLLMLAGVIAFFAAGASGLMCVDVVGADAAGMMIVAAVMFMIVVFGFLSRPRPQYIAAAIMTFGTLAAIAFATLVTHGATVQLEQQILARRGGGIGGVIVVYAATDVGDHLGTLQAARLLNASATFLAFCLLIYLTIRVFQRRPTWA